MLRSILRQLVCSPLPDKIQKLWDDHHRGHTEPPISELLDATDNIIGTYEHVYLVLDALDEYHTDRIPGRLILLDMITQLCRMHPHRLHLVVTSRREPDIRETLQRVASFTMTVDQAFDGDVERFLDKAFNHARFQRWGPELLALASRKLLQSEERCVYLAEHIAFSSKQMSRRFRWTDLQIKRLRRCRTATSFEDALDTIPKSLEETYHQALETIPDDDQQSVRRVLMWMTTSFRELTSSEVAAVMNLPSVEDVLEICQSVLVTVVDNGPNEERIKLAHFTVKEFLIVQEGFQVGLHWYQFTARLANCCVTTQLLELIFACPTGDPTNLPSYGWGFWLAHVQLVNATSDFADCDELQPTIDYLFSDDNRDRLLKGIGMVSPCDGSRWGYVTPPQPLYCASLLGLQEAVVRFWKDYTPHDHNDPDQYPDPNGGFYGGPLETAASMGHTEIVAWMIDRIEDPYTGLNILIILRSIHDNVHQTLRALFGKGPKRMISKEEAVSLAGPNDRYRRVPTRDRLRFLIEENLASVPTSEEMFGSDTDSTLGQKILSFAMRNRSNESDEAVKKLLPQVDTIDPEILKLFDDPTSEAPETWYKKHTFED
jgi:hypothetical protein